MMFNILKSQAPLPLGDEGAIFKAPDPIKLEQREIEKAFARLFLSEDGQKVLAHLQVLTFQRALGANSSDNELRYMEGQRAMMGSILRLIDRGRK